MSRKLRELKLKYGVSDASANLVNRLDPTPTKKYLEWLFKVRYVRASVNVKYRVANDFPSSVSTNVIESLRWFERNLANKVPAEFRDINTFKTITSFLTKVNEIGTPSRKEVKDSVRVVLENERWKVVVPLTPESARLYGSGTRWCTTQKTYFINYTRNGLLYYIIDKGLNRKFGFSVKDNTTGNVSFNENFFNNEDASIRLGTIKQIYGSNFDVVTNSIKLDFTRYTMDTLKRKALGDAIKRIELTRRELTRSKMVNEKIDGMLNSLTDAVNELNTNLT